MFLTPQKGPSPSTPIAFTYYDDFAPGSVTGQWSIDDVRCNRVYTVRLKAFCSNDNAGPLQVIGALSVRLGDTYKFPLATTATETDTGSFVQSIRADRDTEGKGNQWTVTIDYAPFDIVSLLGSSYLNLGTINPLDRAWEVYWDNAKYRRSKPYDESGEQDNGDPGKPYVNTIGDPLLNVPENEETRPVLNLVRNESTYNDAYASQFKDTVNDGEFLGYPPNTVKCRDIKGERFFDADWGAFFKVTYQFEFRDDEDGEGYSQLILNAGYRQKVNGSGSPVNVTDANGQQVTDAVPLKENGAYDPAADAYFLEFVEFPAVNFDDLNIPGDLLAAAAAIPGNQ